MTTSPLKIPAFKSEIIIRRGSQPIGWVWPTKIGLWRAGAAGDGMTVGPFATLHDAAAYVRMCHAGYPIHLCDFL